MIGAKQHNFILIIVELEFIIRHPCINICYARSYTQTVLGHRGVHKYPYRIAPWRRQLSNNLERNDKLLTGL